MMMPATLNLYDITNRVLLTDAETYFRSLPCESLNCIVTSPPYYGLRDYGHEGQLGLEPTPEHYINALVGIFRMAWRTLRDDGTFWLNLGDSYAHDNKWGGSTSGLHRAALHGNTSIRRRKRTSGLPPKSLMGIPWRVALALQEDGWVLRQDIIWSKPAPMPESVTDRCTKSHEYVFLLTKSPRYYFDQRAIREIAVNGEPNFVEPLRYRNKRSVWEVSAQPYRESHFATFPPALIEPMILAGCPSGGLVCDPFMGSGTTAKVARELGRNYTGSEINPNYHLLIAKRVMVTPPLFAFEEVLR